MAGNAQGRTFGWAGLPVLVLVLFNAPVLANPQLPAAAAAGTQASGSESLATTKRRLNALEARRCAAIAAADFTALADVLADDYVHVYGTGLISDKAGYIAAVKAAPRVPTRGPLTIRVYGDFAVLTGELLNRIQYPDQPLRVINTYVTQVAHREGGQWRFVSFQLTQKAAPPG